MKVISTAPRHIQTRYMRGKCWSLAIELARHTGLPLWGLVDARGDIHHAFVADSDKRVAFDIRGEVHLSHVNAGAVAICKPVCLNEEQTEFVQQMADPNDAREARTAIRDHLHGLPRPTRKAQPVLNDARNDEGPAP